MQVALIDKKGIIMRDPNRIDEFCDELKDVWKKVPDWRFMQLMSNFFSYYYSKNRRDPFFIEEKEAMEALKEYINENNPWG